jgi:Kef-type K+ transport system membrane component KefB
VNIFFELSIVIVVAAALSGVMRLLKQPIVIGYVLAGLLLGPQFLNLLKSTETVSVFSEMGIAILLFIVGINLNPKELKSFGKTSFLIGLFQVVVTSALGFILCTVLKFSIVESLYLGVALSFSSTIIVLKLLSDKHDLEKLHSRLATGILLFQDVVVALVLIFTSTFSGGKQDISDFIFLIVKGLALVLVVSILSYYVLPSLSTFFAKSQEYLFIFSLAWGLGLHFLATLGLASKLVHSPPALLFPFHRMGRRSAPNLKLCGIFLWSSFLSYSVQKLLLPV